MKLKGFILQDGILFLFLYTCIIIIYTNSSICEEWCKIASNDSETRYEQCLPDAEEYATYNIDVTLSAPEDQFISGDVTLKIIGDGKETKPITIASANGTLTRLTVERCDVGDLRSLGIHLNGSLWSCEKITIFKESKYWIFDCVDEVNPENEDNQTTFLLSGNKTYIISIQTGNLKDSGTSGSIGITLLGVSGKTNNKILGNSFYSESYLTFQIKAADVGELNGVILSNSAASDPWYCESVRVMLSDKTIASFPVKRWIGKPFDASVKVTTETGTSISSATESTPIDIECSTRAIDIFPGVVTKPFTVVVRCPMNCQADDLVHIEGTSIHPSSTSICGASLLDNVISPSGGDVVVSITQPLKKYFGSVNNEYGLKSQEYEPPANQKYFSFFTFLNESIDNIDSNVRLVDAFGKLTSFGRLEILRNGRWGSVCNKGKYGTFNNKAATLVCIKLGFKHGIHISENCSDVNNQNLCAPPGYSVSYSALRCNGNEDDISKCIFEEPTVDCRTHKDDVVIKCSSYPNSFELEYGTLRLVDATGALSSNGMGRLEFYNNGFGSVCSESWDKNAEKVACLEMGFTGINNNGLSDRECSDMNGTNFCAPYLTKISAVNFKCNGTERYLKQCSHESNDNIYCTHSQDVLISCEGQGDPSEHRNRNRIEPFIPQTKKFNRILNLTCYDNILSHSEFKGPIGKYLLVSCPQNCMNEPSAVNGTFIYTNESPICKSAIHSGIIDNNGGRIVVINAAGQSEFYGSSLNGITTLSAYKNVNALESSAFMVSRPTHYILSKHATNLQVPKDRELGVKRTIEEPFSTAPCKFEWYPNRDWKGFNGKSADYINTKDYPGARMIKVFKNATFIVETTPTGGIDKWNTIFSFQNCGGLTCAIDNFGELVLQENCNAYLLRTGFSPVMGKRIVIAIIYYSITRDISIFVDGKLVVNRNIEFNLNFQGDLIIGKSVDTDADYFIGQITLFRAFDYVLTPEQIRQQYSKAEYGKANHSTKIRMTTGGNVCLSKCAKREFNYSNNATNPAITLTCKDTIENERFNGHTGKTFLVSCAGQCFDPNIPLRGSKIYTSDSSICKAAIHSGAIPKEGGEAIVVIMRGLPNYTNCHGHHGITSQISNRPYLRSFVVHKAPQHIHMTCIDNAIFVLNMHPGSRLLLHCPPGCRDVESDVFGADIYNPVSSLCRAAIHSGKLDNNGGEVEIEVSGEQKHFYSSEANGILSRTSGQYLRSFKILRATSKI